MHLKKYGPYQVGDLLGQGGTGAVFRCFHPGSARALALKVPKLERVEEREALRREIGILSRMTRAQIRGVVRILDHGTEQGTPWYAMELLDGRSLRLWKEQLWNQRASPPAEFVEATRSIGFESATPGAGSPSAGRGAPAPSSVVASPRLAHRLPAAAGQLIRVSNVMLRVAEILAQIHAEGVVHGDLTPSNILFRDEADPVLIDFGIGLAQLAPESFRELPVSAPAGYGTAAYLAPEVLRGELRDARCDLYAFGCILYELVTGTRPYTASDPRDIFRQQLYATPTRPSELVSELSAPLEELILALLEKDPLLRTPRAEDICRILGSQLPQQPKTFRETSGRITLYRPRLHGRDKPFAQLSAALQGLSVDGRGGLVLLSGPSGIGKTRLMNELAAAAGRTKTVALWCRVARAFAPEAQQVSMPSTGLELLSSVIEHVLEAATQDAESSLPPLVVQSLRDVAHVMPPRAGAKPQLGAQADAPAQTRSRAFDGLLTLLKHVATPSGLLLLIDDLQWADELSAAFLRQYARAFSSLPILVVANYRTLASPLAQDFELASLATAHIALDALQPKEMERIAKDILATEMLPAGLFTLLQRYSSGNPFFVAEYTRAAVTSRLLQRVEGGSWSFDAERSAELAMPTSVEGLLGLRVEQLSEPSRRALQQASVLGREFDTACFESLVSSATDPTELLEELVAREILQVASPARYRFAHDALREAQERTLSPDERRHYHTLAAAQLERGGAGPQAGTLGYHWACAGEPRRALDYLEGAAADARAGHTLERASELYRLGIKQCLLLGADAEASRRLIRLTEALADVLRQQAQHAEARERLDQVLAWLTPEQRVAKARIWRKLATSHWTLHDYARASSALDEAEGEMAQYAPLGDADYHTELIEIRLGRFEQLYFSGKVGPALDAVIQGLGVLLEQYGSNDQRCRYYFMAASYVMLKRRYAFDPDALELAERGLAAAVAVAPQRLAMARFILAYALMLGSREQCHSALPLFEEAATEAERLGEATLLSRVRTYHAITSLRVGDTDATAVLANLALEAASEAHLQPYLGAARACQGWVAWRRGEAQRAKTLLEAGRECWRASAHGFPFSNLALFPLLDLACSADDFETGRTLLVECAAGLPALPEPLCGAIREAIRAIDQASALEASRALTQVVHLARELGFA